MYKQNHWLRKIPIFIGLRKVGNYPSLLAITPISTALRKLISVMAQGAGPRPRLAFLKCHSGDPGAVSTTRSAESYKVTWQP